MTSSRFLVGLVVGAVGAWYLERKRNDAGPGVGGARPQGRNQQYSGLGRFRR